MWATNEDGGKVPLDPRPAVYDVEEVEGEIQAVRDHTAMVTHFATCPDANKFSGKRGE